MNGIGSAGEVWSAVHRAALAPLAVLSWVSVSHMKGRAHETNSPSEISGKNEQRRKVIFVDGKTERTKATREGKAVLEYDGVKGDKKDSQKCKAL